MDSRPNVFDAAKYILEKCGPMSTIKLQKLVYYAQAWSLVWDEDVLFDEEIEAWANGPVVRKLFESHRGMYRISASDLTFADSKKFNKDQRETMDVVIEYYGRKDSQWLSDLTHSEDPWREARKGLSEGERGSNVIPKAVIQEYYSSL